MRKNKIDYPFPVLADERDDYVACRFGITCKPEIENKDIIINLNYDLISEGLTEMISSEKVTVSAIIESPFASYRQIYSFDSGKTDIQIKVNKNSVVKKIEVSAFIISSEENNNFYLDEFNQLYYKNNPQIISKGDILAKSQSIVINLDASELEKPISSIFNITERENMENNIDVSFEEEKINIYLAKETYGTYYNLREFNNGSFRRYLSAVVVLPVLVEAIDMMKGIVTSDVNEYENYKDLRWYKAIIYKLKENNIDLENYLEVNDNSSITFANMLLGDIVSDALISFKNTIDDEMDGETERIGGED